MKTRAEYLSKHEYKIWQGKDGKWYTYLPDEEKGRVLKKRSTQKEVENVVIGYYKAIENEPTIRELFTEWNDRRASIGKISQATHMRNQQIFNRHYSALGSVKITSVTEYDISEFLEEQIFKYNLTAKAFSNLKSITKGFLKYAKKKKIITLSVDNIFADIDVSEVDFKVNIKEDYEMVFDESEMPKMLEYLEKNCDMRNLGIMLMFVTGVRVGELVTLKQSDLLDSAITIRRTETRFIGEDEKYHYEVKEFPKSKAGVRTVAIPTGYLWILKKMKLMNPFGEYVFEEKGRRLNTQNIRNRLKRVCKKVNVYPKSPHKIRATYGTILLDNNVDKKMVMGQMGHADILVTEQHYHRNRRNIDNKVKILDNIKDFTPNLITW